MKAILIIDKNNVDSCLAATMMVHAFKGKGVVESIHTPRHSSISIPKDATSIYILGVELTPYQLVKMLDGLNPNVVVNYRYSESPDIKPVADAGVLRVQRYYEITPFTIMSENTKGLKTQAEHYHDNCISSMVYDSFLNCIPPTGNAMGTGKGAEASDYVRFIKCVRTYFGMGKFPGVFNYEHAKGKAAICSDTDIGFFYSNLDALRKAAIDAEPFLPVLRIARNKSVFEAIQTAKDHAARTSNKIIFSDGNAQTEVPCFNVGEERAFEIMRLVANTSPTVVTYEDLESRRVWRVYTTNPKMLDLLMKTCDMIGSPWSHGKITYFESDIPGTGKTTVVKSAAHMESNSYVYTPPKQAKSVRLLNIVSMFKKKQTQSTDLTEPSLTS